MKMTRRRYDELDGYRGLAALAIVAYHAYLATSAHWADNAQRYAGTPAHLLLRNLDAGVSLFFVLSGFVIFLPFARAALDGSPAPARGGFLARRALRILPLYWLATLIVWALGLSRGEVGAGALLANLTLIHQALNLPAVIGPSWSLCHEAAFYVALALAGPVLCRHAARLPSRRERAALLCLGIAVVVAASGAYKALLMASELPGTVRAWATFQPLATVDQFAFGMLLAVGAAYGLCFGARATWALRAVAATLQAAACVWRVGTGATDYARPGVLFFGALCGASFALLIASTVLARIHGRYHRALASRALCGLGIVSYGVYLLHEEPLLELLLRRGDTPILDSGAFVANVAILAVAAILLAAAIYRYIESPALRLAREHRQGRTHRPAPLATPPPRTATS